MKKCICSALAWVVFAAAAPAMGERLYLIKIVDFDKSVAYELRSNEEWKALQSEVKADAKLYQKALDGARAEWKEDLRTAKKPFPSSAIGQKQASLMGSPYLDRERAQAKLDTYLDRSSRKEASKLDRQKEDQKRQKDVLKMSDEQIKKEADKAQERTAFEQLALEFFKRKMDELKGVVSPDAAASKAPAGQPPQQ